MRLLAALLLAAVALVVAQKTTAPPAVKYCVVGKAADCASNEFCEQVDGLCGGHGVCSKKPTNCYKIYRPVCACDNTTYSNECDAKAAGVNVLYLGACKGSDNCTSNSNCHKDEYCELTACKGEGKCAARPDTCLMVYDPVCGCDGNTYTNPCEAASRGSSVVASGACPSDSCLSDQACMAKNNNTFCRFSSDCTGNGICIEPPEFCLQLWRPVCGCDGHTYSNECYAAAAYTSIKSFGPCSDDE